MSTGRMGAKMTRGVPFAVKRWAARLVLALPWVVAGALVWYTFPRGAVLPSPVPGSIVLSPRPAVVTWAGRVLLAAWCANITFVVYRAVARRSVAWFMFAGAALVLVPMAGLWCVFSMALGCWSDVSQLRVESGRTYHWLHRWESEALADEVSLGVFLRTRVIGVNDNERGYYALVRPTGVARYRLPRPTGGRPDRSHLAESRDHRWVVSLSSYQSYPRPKNGCAANLIYDQVAGKFFDWKELGRLSPFLLVEPGDQLERGDVEALLVGGQEYVQGCSDVRVLSQDSTNPNPAVRAVVAQLLAETYPGDEANVTLATRVLEQMADKDADPGVRKAARGALAGLRSSVQQRAK